MRLKKICFILALTLISVSAGIAVAQDSQSDNMQASQPVASPTGATQDSAGRPVGITTPAPPPTPEPKRAEFESNVKDVHFDFNQYDLTADDHAILQQDAQWLQAHPDIIFTIEGDADDRGTISYNLYLSDERALAARDELIKLGVPQGQILFATGWGKLYPTCQQDDESCWAQNRRSHFAPWPMGLEERVAHENTSAQNSPPEQQ
jgi:peptidoglycan-associated lipoprotein